MCIATAVVVAGGWILRPGAWRRVRRAVHEYRVRRRDREVCAALPDFCSGVARRLMVGETLLMAMNGAAEGSPVAPEMAAIARRHARGVPMVHAVGEWAGRSASPDVRMIAMAVELSSEGTGAQPELFDRIGHNVARRQAAIADARSHAAQAHLSGWVVASLPWVVLVAVLAERGAAAEVVLWHPIGRFCLGAALGLEVLGVWWMRRMIGSVAS